jgi:hypothetical protein
MAAIRMWLAALSICLAMGLMACTSPEAERTRGGGPGADIGNRSSVVDMHEGSQPYYQTPCVTTLDICTGPLPVFGRARSDRGSMQPRGKIPAGAPG